MENIYKQKYDQFIKDMLAGKKISTLKAVRMKCFDCMCWQVSEIEKCTCTDCPLYLLRFGKNPTGGKRRIAPASLAALQESRRK